jgi:hypothetical protein
LVIRGRVKVDFDATKRGVRSKRLLRQLLRVVAKGAWVLATLIASSVCSDTSFSQGVRLRDFLAAQRGPERSVGPPGFNLVSWGPYYDEPNGTCGYGNGMFLFSSDRIRFVMPLLGSESNQNLAGARGALTDDSRRFIFEIKSDSCIYRTTIEKLIRKGGDYLIVPFDNKPPLEVNTPELRIWMGTFSDSEDSCFSATGSFYYSNDRIRFVMPIHVIPDLVEEGGPNKHFGGSLEGTTDGNQGYTTELKSPNCKYLITIEKLAKVDGEYQMVPMRRSMAPTKAPPP